jgi:hypothetical protein
VVRRRKPNRSVGWSADRTSLLNSHGRWLRRVTGDDDRGCRGVHLCDLIFRMSSAAWGAKAHYASALRAGFVLRRGLCSLLLAAYRTSWMNRTVAVGS